MHPIRLIAADGAAPIMVQPSRSVILDGSCNANSLPDRPCVFGREDVTVRSATTTAWSLPAVMPLS